MVLNDANGKVLRLVLATALLLGSLVILWNDTQFTSFTASTQEKTQRLKYRGSHVKTISSSSLQNNTVSKHDYEAVPFLFPKPQRRKTVNIYNQEAWNRLHELVVATPQKTKVSITSNGGSSTAGGALTDPKFKFHFQYVNFLKSTKTLDSKTEISVTERGHGNRNSFHSAMLSKSFFEPGTDVLFWEFAINDESYARKYHAESQKREHMANVLIYWLDAVSRIQPKPPVVILCYLWSSPFRFDEYTGEVVNPIFEVHQHITREYDFVVGHVNLASYLDELGFNFTISKQLFLADHHHPTDLGHAVLAHLLLDLTVDTNRRAVTETGITSSRDIPTTFTDNRRTPVVWNCGNETRDKQLLQSRLLTNTSFPRFPSASFTFEEPRNQEQLTASSIEEEMTTMMIHMSSEHAQLATLGKANPVRNDRQYGVVLPCCSSGAKETFAIVPTTTRHNNKNSATSHQDAAKTITGQAFHIGFFDARFGNIRIFLNKDLEQEVKIRRIPAFKWPCFLDMTDIYQKPFWYAFPEERANISRIHVCAEHKRCKTAGAVSSGMDLTSLTVY